MVKRKSETREEYLARERERDRLRNSRRDRALYLREYACKKLHGCSLAEWLVIKEANKSTADLAKRQVMDAEKVELLISHGVRVFVVPYTKDSLRKIRVFLTAAGLDLWTS